MITSLHRTVKSGPYDLLGSNPTKPKHPKSHQTELNDLIT